MRPCSNLCRQVKVEESLRRLHHHRAAWVSAPRAVSRHHLGASPRVQISVSNAAGGQALAAVRWARLMSSPDEPRISPCRLLCPTASWWAPKPAALKGENLAKSLIRRHAVRSVKVPVRLRPAGGRTQGCLSTHAGARRPIGRSRKEIRPWKAQPNLALPYIMPSQAQKHVTHNEALQILDALVQLSLKSRRFSTPPDEPSEGDRYLVGPGRRRWLARPEWIDRPLSPMGGWNFATPRSGYLAWIGGRGKS